MKICIIFGHNNTKNSFNASIRDSFIDEAIKVGHQIDVINLFDEKSGKSIRKMCHTCKKFPIKNVWIKFSVDFDE